MNSSSPTSAASASCCGTMDAGGDPAASSCEIPSETGVNMTPTLSLFLIGVTGNLVALVVLQKRRPSKSRTLFYTLLTGLILNDLLAQLLTSSAPLLVYAMGQFNDTSKRLKLAWLGGRTACQAHALVMTAVWLGEPLLVLCMSAERLLCLTRWQSYSRMHHKRRRTAVGMLAGLAAVLGVATLPMTGVVGAYRLQYPGTWCFLDSRGGVSLRHRVFAAALALWDLLAVAMIAACNLWVIRCLLTVRRTRKTLSQAAADAASNGNAATAVAAAGMASRPPKHMRYMEVQLVVLLVGITASFGLCWTPLMIRVLVNSLFNGSDCRKDLAAVHLASINQILDPWLYILLRRSNFIRLWQLMKRGAAVCGWHSNEFDNRVNLPEIGGLANRRQLMRMPQHLRACQLRRHLLNGSPEPPPPTAIGDEADMDAAAAQLVQLHQQQQQQQPSRQPCCNCSCHLRKRYASCSGCRRSGPEAVEFHKAAVSVQKFAGVEQSTEQKTRSRWPRRNVRPPARELQIRRGRRLQQHQQLQQQQRGGAAIIAVMSRCD